MAATVETIKDATDSVLGAGEVSVDNFTFRLFYKLTVSFFVGSSVASMAAQFFGDPLKCEICRDEEYQADDCADEDLTTTYCWMYATFDMPANYKGYCTRRVPDHTNLYNSYYQWVSIFLMIQALLFYIPRCIWLSMEGGLMHFLVNGCQGRTIENAEEKQYKLLDLFEEHVHNKFNKYTFCFFFCELLNLLFCACQIYVTDMLLNQQFMDYGYQIINYYSYPYEQRYVGLLQENRTALTPINPMCEVFPKVVTCDYINYARAGGMSTKNAICILNLNMINDKIFALLWFWNCFLIIAGIGRILSRGVQMCSTSARHLQMKLAMYKYLANNKHSNHVQHYIKNCSIGDWFVLYQMNKNMNDRFFAEFLALLSLKVNPDPELSADPEINILGNGKAGHPEDDGFYDDDDLEEMQKKLKRRKAWRRKVNFFTGKRRLTKKRTGSKKVN